MREYRVIVNEAGMVDELYATDGERPAPEGALPVSRAAADRMRGHPRGHGVFRYDAQTGEVSLDTAHEAALEAAGQRERWRQELRDRARRLAPGLGQHLELLELLWPMLDTTQAPDELRRAKAVALRLRQRLEQLEALPDAAVAAFDPGAGW